LPDESVKIIELSGPVIVTNDLMSPTFLQIHFRAWVVSTPVHHLPIIGAINSHANATVAITISNEKRQINVANYFSSFSFTVVAD